MNKKQVIVLWIIAVVLVVTLAVVRARLSDVPESASKFSRGDQLAAGLDPAKIAKAIISDAGKTTTLVKGETAWTVTERQDYPADLARLSRTVGGLTAVEAVQAYEAGPKYDPRFGMDENAEDAESHGVHVEFLDTAGQSLLKIALGKEATSQAGADPMSMQGMAPAGRYLRVSSDPGSVYVVNESLRDFVGHPAAWLDKEFIKVAKIKDITLRAPGDGEFEPWTVTRASATDPFTLEGLGDNEEMQTSAASPLNNLFSNLRFADVVEAETITSDGDPKGARQAIITTFEGFTYTFNLTPKKAAAGLSEEDFNPNAENYYLTVTVTADLAQEREKKPEESEEEAKAADESFAAEKMRLEEKLAAELAYQGRAFELTRWSLDSILKERSELVQAKAEDPGSSALAPPAGATAVSPPIQIPFAPAPTPGDEAPAADPPAEDAPAEDAPAEDAPAETAPADAAPAENAPAEDAPAGGDE